MAMLYLSISVFAYDFEVNNVFYTVLSVPELTVSVAASPDKYQGTITIPQTVEWSGRCFNVISIDSEAFYDCSGLKEIYIPRGIKTINSDAFSRTNIEKVHLDDIESWLNVTIKNSGRAYGHPAESSPFNNGASLCIGGELIENLIIPEGIETLNNNFSGCGSIRKVTLPESCSYLDESFAQCKNLETIDPKGANITIGGYTFSGCDKVNFDFLDKCCSLSSNAFSGCEMSRLSITNTITKVGYGVCEYCPNLEYCFIGNGISELPYKRDYSYYNQPEGMNMFNGCNRLKIIEIEDSELPLNVNYCGYNKYVDIDNVRYWGSFTRFNLESISLYRQLSYEDSYTDVYAPFAGCKSLKKAYIGGSSTTLDNDFFRNCCSLECVTLGENIENIDGSVFKNCNNLKQIRLESSVPPNFSSGAFSHSQLLSIVIIVPDGCVDVYMQSIGWKEFLNIVEESSAEIDPIIISNNWPVSVSTDGIIYEGENGASILICGIDGKCQYSGIVSSGQSIVLSKGIYIVTLNGKSIKVKI